MPPDISGQFHVAACCDPSFVPAELHALQIKDMIRALLTDSQPPVDIYAGKETVQVVLAAYEASSRGCKVVVG